MTLTTYIQLRISFFKDEIHSSVIRSQNISLTNQQLRKAPGEQTYIIILTFDT